MSHTLPDGRTVDRIGDEDNWEPEREVWPEYGPYGEEGRRLMGQEALALLLTDDGIAFLVTTPEGYALPAVNCNDIFGYGVSDCEPIPHPEMGDGTAFWELYDWVRLHGGLGAIAWATKRRGYAPIEPRVNRLKEEGIWHLTGLGDT